MSEVGIAAFGGGGGGGGGKGGGFLGGVVESVGSVFESVGDAVATVVEPVIQTVSQAVETTVEAVSDVGVSIDEGVNDTIPGGWVTVGAIAATVATAGAAGAGMFAAEGAAAGSGFGISAAGTSTGIGLSGASVGTGIGLTAASVPTLTSGLAIAGGSALAGTAAGLAAESAFSIAGAESALAAEGISAGVQTVAEVGAYTAETAGAIAETGTAWTAEVAATQEAVSQAALQQAAGSGALKGAASNALGSVIQGRDISPEGLMIGAATGAVGGGLGNVASNAAAEYGSLAAKTAGGLGGSLGGALTGAALTGGDLGKAAISGGIAGLTGAAGAGMSAGLNELGVDPVGSSILAKTALGAGQAAAKGGDALTGAFNAAAGTGLGMGIGAATDAAGNYIVNAGKDVYNTGSDYLKSLIAEETPEQKLTQLASSNTMSDTSPSPLEEAVGNIGSVSVYDPSTGLPVKQEQSPESQEYMKQLLEALYPDVAVEGVVGAVESEKSEMESLDKIDSQGNIYDDAGQIAASAVELGLVKGADAQGNDVWITQNGDFIPANTETQPTPQLFDLSSQIQTPAPASETSASDLFGLGESESAADYPQNIINNPDGSVTIVENDGTQRIFNVDGSVSILDSEGNSSEEFSAAPKAEEAAATENKPQETSTLGNIAGSLLGTAAGMGMSGGSLGGGSMGTSGGKIPSWVPGIAGLGAGIAAGISNANSGGQAVNPFNYNQYGFDFGQRSVNPVQNGIAQGQQFFNPTYTPTPPVQAAEGGLMSMPNTVQSTVTNNGLRLDPSSSVQMYSKGGNIDSETMSIVKHLKTGGAPMHHIAGFLDYRQKKMAQGGHLGGYSDGGRMLKGPGDGMSDDIPASIAGIQPARLANEEFVIPADVVSHLGNGSSEAGSKVLYNMMDKVRKARTGHTKQGKQINPEKLMPKARK